MWSAGVTPDQSCRGGGVEGQIIAGVEVVVTPVLEGDTEWSGGADNSWSGGGGLVVTSVLEGDVEWRANSIWSNSCFTTT